MTIFHFRFHGGLWVTLLIATSLSGCGGFGGDLLENRQQITIDSDPQAASVYAEGVEIGKTPLVIRPNEVFQARFTGGDAQTGGLFVYRYVGSLSIKNPGCEPYSTQVNDNILSKDIHVQLECDPDYKPAEAQPSAPPVSVTTPAAKPASIQGEIVPAKPAGSAEERLLQIESLRQKGLLSEEEYRTLRQRVLDTL
ncbi:MAG: hypothetical protein OEM43_09505 [Gammaproteobacteria bacterium]|nr:hypothetical protein [Gammaproteobacteria bacterium]